MSSPSSTSSSDHHVPARKSPSPKYASLPVYAFLNHSPDTLPHNLPPSVDDKPLARQRRRRTSPDDQATLEAAYLRDPKPDKAARLELVQRVALGEKEVQTSRRKSRPLLPHEVAQYHMARAASSPGHAMDLGRDPPGSTAVVALPGSDDSSGSIRPESSCGSSSSSPSSGEEAPVRHSSSLQSDGVPEKTPSIGYLANRRSAPALRCEGPVDPKTEVACPSLNVDQPPRLKKSSSIVRLSMTADGTARVVTKDTASPSPPRKDPSSTVSPLSGAVSAIKLPLPSTTSLQRSSSGRSRDSRTWEFWCDKDARYDLQDKAQKDASGSAADAIGLLRSTSGRAILGVIPSKRNPTALTRPPPPKRAKGAPHGTLNRSHTSFARLEGKPSPALKPPPDSPTSITIPGNESDKENWSPKREGGAPDPHSPARPRVARAETFHGHSRPSYAKTEGGVSSSKRAAAGSANDDDDDDDDDPEADPELAAFMRGKKRASGGATAQEEEMDCVQGLLSLSQGNWR